MRKALEAERFVLHSHETVATMNALVCALRRVSVECTATLWRNACVIASFIGSSNKQRMDAFLVSGISIYLDDKTLCRLSCAEHLTHSLTRAQRHQKKEEQPLTLRLKGRAECEMDCASISLLLRYSETAPFVTQVFYVDDAESLFDKLLHIEFSCTRKSLLTLHEAVKIFLEDLISIEVFYVLRETLTFSDEYTGIREYDNGAFHRADICNRLVAKASHLPKHMLDLLG